MSTFPPITPLERLQVTDGLLLTAERWQLAHTYHRHRQNLHFQALNEPGIVCGLGVRPIAAPANMPAQYRDQRWLQIQPGIAIDAAGNPIIVPHPLDYRIAADPAQEPLLIYLVVSYVDPDRLDHPTSRDVVQETFRVEEKVSPPDDTEVELCRLLLQPGGVQVRSPLDCFAPQVNELDLRYRQWVQRRAQGQVRIGQLTTGSPVDARAAADWLSLLDSLEGLYPTLQGADSIGQIALQDAADPALLLDSLLLYDLLSVPYSQCVSWRDADLEVLKQYIQAGGVVLIEIPASVGSNLTELIRVRFEVEQAVGLMDAASTPQDMRQELEAELVELDACITDETQHLIIPIQPLIQANGGMPLGKLPLRHPIQSRPFQFGRFPIIRKSTVEVLNWGGVVLVVGELSSGWGGAASLGLQRETIRSAQELGINLLHFAWQRRRLTQGVALPTAVPPPTRSRRTNLTDILNQLDT